MSNGRKKKKEVWIRTIAIKIPYLPTNKKNMNCKRNIACSDANIILHRFDIHVPGNSSTTNKVSSRNVRGGEWIMLNRTTIVQNDCN